MSTALLNYIKRSTGLIAVLSLILPYCMRFDVYSPAILRPILNVAWAFVFGTHIWYLIFSSDDFFVTGGDEGSFFSKKRDLTLTDSADECTKFFVVTLFSNALIVITTHGLAPYYTYVKCCSILSLLATLTNTFLVPKTLEPKVEGIVFKHVSPSTCSKALSLMTCLALAIYSLL